MIWKRSKSSLKKAPAKSLHRTRAPPAPHPIPSARKMLMPDSASAKSTSVNTADSDYPERRHSASFPRDAASCRYEFFLIFFFGKISFFPQKIGKKTLGKKIKARVISSELMHGGRTGNFEKIKKGLGSLVGERD
jgi:hypothetical protein